MRYSCNKLGFSLIEVNLAILLIAVGLLALFSLFPLGLKESERGLADTQEAMFADTVLSVMEGNALNMTNWSDWANSAGFRQKVLAGISLSKPIVAVETINKDDPAETLVFPKDSRYKIRYKLQVNGSEDRKSATLYVMHGEYGNFKLASVFYTEFVYTGM